jgi:hypothetical protein
MGWVKPALSQARLHSGENTKFLSEWLGRKDLMMEFSSSKFGEVRRHFRAQ